MTARPRPADSPPLWLIAPFFLAAPFGLMAGGLLLATSNSDALVAINLPQTVAITHAVVVGWIATTIMGAVYQLGPVIIGGKLLSQRLARIQLVVHIVAVAGFVPAVRAWNTEAMAMAGILLTLSFTLFVVNASACVIRAKARSLTRAYLAAALVFLAATFSLGLTYAMALRHLWFPITLGRLSAHAHIGLVGFIGLTLMGVSYQLVPMFAVVQHARQRLGRSALILTVVSLVTFAFAVAAGAGPWLRVLLAGAMAVGPSLWAIDEVHLLRHRGKRRLDVQGYGTYLSIGFLGLTIVLGLGAAWGTPATPNDEPARWLLAYGIAGIAGWAGLSLVGNSYKIVPFLLWFHRYLPRVGSGPVPVTADIYNDRAANVVLAVQASAVALGAAAALTGTLPLLRSAGMLLVLAGLGHELTLLHMFLPKTASQRAVTSGVRRIPS